MTTPKAIDHLLMIKELCRPLLGSPDPSVRGFANSIDVRASWALHNLGVAAVVEDRNGRLSAYSTASGEPDVLPADP